MIDLEKVDRVEVIDSKGRAFTRYGCADVKMDLQDDGRTLKIFVASQWRLDRNGGADGAE